MRLIADLVTPWIVRYLHVNQDDGRDDVYEKYDLGEKIGEFWETLDFHVLITVLVEYSQWEGSGVS